MTARPTATVSARMPDIRRADAHAAFVSGWYVPDAEHGRSALDDIFVQWERSRWPEDFLSFSGYLSTDDGAVLTYAQCSGSDSYRPFVRARTGVARAEPVEYRTRRSVTTSTSGDPGCMIIAMFDVDGPDRQDAVIDSLVDTLHRAPGGGPPGMLSANFHASVDGTRVLNYAEWTSDEAHIAFLAGTTRKATLQTSNSLPGVRPIGFRRYHLYRALTR
jgi:Antibiotic biosynthesis monooxygenase